MKILRSRLSEAWILGENNTMTAGDVVVLDLGRWLCARSLWEFRLLSVHVPPIRLNYEGAAWIPKLYRHGFNRETMDRWIIPRYGEMLDLFLHTFSSRFIDFDRVSICVLWQIWLNLFQVTFKKQKRWKNIDWMEDEEKKRKLNFCNSIIVYIDNFISLATSEVLFIRKRKRHVSKFSITGPIPGIFFISHDR